VIEFQMWIGHMPRVIAFQGCEFGHVPHDIISTMEFGHVPHDIIFKDVNLIM
jgi:hypothetical protein